MRIFVSVIGLGLLAACSPQVPDSGAGVGFDTDPASADARLARDAALTTGQPVVQPGALSAETVGLAGSAPGAPAPVGQPLTALRPAPTVVTTNSANSDDIAAEAAAALAASSANSGIAPVQASPSNPAPALLNNPGISDENDFAAVSGRQTIASDAERLAQNRANYQIVTPTSVPTRSGGGAQSTIVSYALSTSHAPGTQVYSRAGINKNSRAVRNCARYVSADQAQEDFLKNGGPQRDRKGLDPDGDGFACGWDPKPFRQAVRSN